MLVLNLFELKPHIFGHNGEFGHVGLVATGMRRYEIRDYLLAQSGAFVYAVEDLLETAEEFETGLTHDVDDRVGSMFRRYFQASRDVTLYEFAVITPVVRVGSGITGRSHGKIIADSAADKRLLYARKGIDGVI